MPEYNPTPGGITRELDQLRRLHEKPVEGVHSRIDPADEMFDANREHYFGVGQSAMRMVRLAMLAGGTRPEGIKEILDLPCGHGRVLRTLRAAFPGAGITACDIRRDGVDYCARTFGAKPVYSRNPIAEVDLGGRFDLIWCGSLLTHLDGESWIEFLDCFEKHLNLGGLLVFTIHGRSVLKRFQSGWDYGLDIEGMRRVIAGVQSTGFGYVDYPNNAGYGISIAGRDWTMKMLARYRRLKALLYCDRGWDDHQDVVACSLEDWDPPVGPAHAIHEKLDLGLRL